MAGKSWSLNGAFVRWEIMDAVNRCQSYPSKNNKFFGWLVISTWWLIPLSKWIITPIIRGLTLLIPFITGVITHLLSGMSHQVDIPTYSKRLVGISFYPSSWGWHGEILGTLRRSKIFWKPTWQQAQQAVDMVFITGKPNLYEFMVISVAKMQPKTKEVDWKIFQLTNTTLRN